MCVAFRDCDARNLSLHDNSYTSSCYCYLFARNTESLISYVSAVLRRRYRDGYFVYRLSGDRLAYDDIGHYVSRLIRRLLRRGYNDYAIVSRLAFVYGLR